MRGVSKPWDCSCGRRGGRGVGEGLSVRFTFDCQLGLGMVQGTVRQMAKLRPCRHCPSSGTPSSVLL